MMKKRVLIISEVFFPEIGSGANRINNMVMLLKENGYDVDVLTSNPSYPNKEIYENEEFWDKEKQKKLYEESNIYRVKESKLRRTEKFMTRLYIYLYSMVQALIKLISINEKYDFIIATVPSIFIGVVGAFAKIKFKATYILDIRDLWPECLKNIGVFRKNKFLLKCGYILEKILLKTSNALIINSDGFRKYLLNLGYKNPIIFLPNGITKEEMKNIQAKKSMYKKNSKFTVIYTGMLGLPQNVKSIVKAANQLRNYNDIQFKIIGTGIQKQKVIDLIKHYNIANVELIEPMPKYDVLDEVLKSHVAVAHLRGDSAFDLVIPGKIIDYMSIGIPIIAGVEGYTAEVVEESKSGIVIEPDDYGAMAKEIKRIYNNRELAYQYAEAGLDYCKETFLWQKNIRKLIEVIEGVEEVNE